jgi:acetyl esterase/lipase
VRWLKWKARTWNGDPSKIGIYGSSSGGHVAELLGMRPRDPRYNAIPLDEAPSLDATVAYIATRSPISNTFARFQNAEKLKRASMVTNNTTFFKPWDMIHEANPQEILERHESVTLVPLLIMQGGLMTTCCPRFRRSSPQPTTRPAASAGTSCSKAASTNGWPNPGRRRTAPVNSSKPSSHDSSQVNDLVTSPQRPRASPPPRVSRAARNHWTAVPPQRLCTDGSARNFAIRINAMNTNQRCAAAVKEPIGVSESTTGWSIGQGVRHGRWCSYNLRFSFMRCAGADNPACSTAAMMPR